MIIQGEKQEYLAGKIVEFFDRHLLGEGDSFILDGDHFGGLKVYFGEENKPKKVLHPCPDFGGVKVYVGKDE